MLCLTAYNWQKLRSWSKKFQLYFKNDDFCDFFFCEILGTFVKNWYFVNNCLIKVQI